MGLTPALWTAFLAGLPPVTRADAERDPSLADKVEAALTAARGELPQLALDDALFARYLAERLDEAEAPARALDGLRVGELYLACACIARLPGALELLEHRYFGELDGALVRMNLGSASPDDVKQILRQQMLVGSEDTPPRISQYAGRGALAGWLRVSAVRAALKLARPSKREVAGGDDDRLFELPTPDSAPELAQLKRDYQADFRAAFVAALAELPDRDKNLIRQHHIDDLSIDELAVLYKVHRATAARWVVSARQELLSRTRAALIDRVKIDEGDCDSIMRLVHSQLDLTLRRLLG